MQRPLNAVNENRLIVCVQRQHGRKPQHLKETHSIRELFRWSDSYFISPDE